MSPLPSAPLQRVQLDGGGGVLSGDQWVAFIPELDALTGLLADFGELLGGFLNIGHPQSIAVMHHEKSAMLWSGPLPSRRGGAPASERA
jgi:hypothetical protein